jgi:hypothetical protein
VLTVLVAISILGIPLRSCQILASSGATYVLQNDVSAAGTCFSIQANKITLNLNGHTVTYGSKGGAHARYGVVGMACWDPDLNNGRADGNPCGDAYNELTVMNGSIVQANTAPAYSHAVRLGQSGAAKASLHDLSLTVRTTSSIPIWIDYSSGGLQIYKNTIHNEVTDINNRHRLEGMSIKSEDDAGCKLPNIIHHNVIIGGAQGGILTRCKGSQIYSNDIAQNGHYTNDFAIYASGQFQNVYDNYVHPIQGRGIGGGDADTHGTRIHHNRIVVIEKANNVEYGGCQIDGTYGITQRNTYGTTIDHNQVTVKSDGCGGTGIKMTEDVGSGGSAPILIHDNTITAININGQTAQPLRGLANDHTTSRCCIYQNNIVISDSYFAGVDWQGGDDAMFIGNTFALGNNPLRGATGLVFWGCGNPGSSTNNWAFTDMVYQNGAQSNTRMLNTGSDAGCSTSYFFEWTYSLKITNRNGQPVMGAVVSVADSTGLTHSGTSDANGHISLALTEVTHKNDGSRRDFRIEHNPQDVSITANTCATLRYTLDIHNSTEESRKLTCR